MKKSRVTSFSHDDITAVLFFIISLIFSPSVTHASTLLSANTISEYSIYHFTKGGSPYIVDGPVYYRYGILTIDPGVIFKFKTATSSFMIHAEVNLTSMATKEDPIYFTSYKDDAHGGDTNGDGNATSPSPGDWAFVSIGCGSRSKSPIPRFMHILYGGGPVADETNPVSLMVCYWAYPGQMIQLSDIELAHNLNGMTIYNNNYSYIALTDSSIHDNVNFGFAMLWPFGLAGMTLQNNWWGSPNGPRSPDNPGGDGDVVIPNVPTIPWLTEDPMNVAQVIPQAPAITLLGGATTTVEFGSTFADPGATASDPTDGDLTNSVHVTGTVNTSQLGTTTLVYSVTNSHGYTASTTRNVVVACTVDCYDNVMFLPGIEGSRLYERNVNNAVCLDQDPITHAITYPADCMIWEPNAGSQPLKLSMNADGSSSRKDIYTKDVIDNAYVPGQIGNVYASFLTQMKQWEHDYHIIATTTPYDWRLDFNALLTNGYRYSDGTINYNIPPEQGHDPYIIETLKKLAATSPSGKVTIIAHSMGGLIAKDLLVTYPEYAQYVDKVILVATPQLGTPKAVGVLLHGFGEGLPAPLAPLYLTANDSRLIAQNMPSAYALLPSTNYFTWVDDPVIDINPTTLPNWSQAYGNIVHSSETLGQFMTDTSGLRTKPSSSDLVTPEIVNAALFQKEVDMHTLIDNWKPPAGMQLYTIAGWGEETFAGLQYTKITTSTCDAYKEFPNNCTLSSEIGYRVKTVIDGDGVVVEPSALWANGVSTTTRYWANLNIYNGVLPGFLRKKHSAMLEIDGIQKLLKNILLNGTDAQMPFNYIQRSPITTNILPGRLHFVLHSPVTLGFADSEGRYTGATATTTEYNIPGVDYERFGEVQWLSVPTEMVGHVVMHGTGTGSFALDVEEQNGNMVTSTTTFAAIPTSTSTVAKLAISPMISPSTSSILSVDFDGDGNVDTRLKARKGSVVLPDPTAPSTTITIRGTKGTNGWYTSNTMITLSASDSESDVANITFTIDGLATTTLPNHATTTIEAEGIHTCTYYATDNAGNHEEATTNIIKIDRTSPEASLTVSTSTKDLIIAGNDNLSAVTVTKTGNMATLTDQAGNTTTLTFQKTYSGTLLTTAKLTRIQYGTAAPIPLPSAFVYLWNPFTPILLSQTVTANKDFLVQALYDKTKNKTTTVVFKKNARIQSVTTTGLELITLSTSKGAVNYSW